MPQYKLSIDKENKQQSEIFFMSGKSLLQILQEEKIYVDGICGGTGRCKKCGIRFVNGATEPDRLDEEAFTKDEIAEGWRLACCSYPQEDCTVAVEEFKEYVGISTESSEAINFGGRYGLAIDIGTTTIIYALVDLEKKEQLETFSQLNLQRQYGADIISRIQTANAGKSAQLQEMITGQLADGLHRFMSMEGVTISQTVIAANTTMVHLLMGYSCEGLGAYPFKPAVTDMLHTDTHKLLQMKERIPITIMTGISAFVGGDILTGITCLQLGEGHKKQLLIDLGTNAEMALADGNGHILVTSAAAGPAFEGGNISAGVGSIPGAISHAAMIPQGFMIRTIQNKPPVGICGSGILDIIYELRKADILDETGLLQEEYFEDGYPIACKEDGAAIRISQKDIREFQMAKAAIRAAIRILFEKSGMAEEDVETVYLAGAFGYFLDTVKTIGIGLFPKEWNHKIQACGNTSLAGSIRYLTGDDNIKELQQKKQHCIEIYLSNEDEFETAYLQYMYL